MNIPLRVLVVEDSEDDTLLVMRELRRGGYAPMFERVDAPEAFTAALARPSWDVIITDYSMPHFSGLKALALLKESGHDLPFIIVSGAIGEDVAVSAMKAGAHDYLMKDNLARLGPAVQRELHDAKARLARRRAERLLQALNEAALAMERALTPEEIFTAAAEEFKKLGFFCTVFLTDESRSRLLPTFFSYSARAVKTAEKLLDLKAEEFTISVETVDVFRRSVREKQTVFVDNVEDVARQLLPEPLERYTQQLVRILETPKSINAPLVVDNEVIGVLSVQSDDLVEDDMPTITAFAHQMAAAWRKTRLLQDLERSLEELKQTQAQFVQAQKMEAIGTLAGGVAHDFNNLLTIINGYAELMELELSPNDSCRVWVDRILGASRSAGAVVRQLLAFSRQEAARPVVLDLNTVITDAISWLGRFIGEDVELINRLDPDLATVQADPGQMEQVLMNLAINARDAMPAGGRLTIETANAALDEGYASAQVEIEPGKYVLLTISDTGVGMDDEVLSHIFEPFFTTKPKGKGTGLGLATVYGIVGQHGGHIRVHSELGRGTTFDIYLPVYQPSQNARPKEIVEPQAGRAARPTGGETLLVVEDEMPVREMIQVALEGYGYTVLCASNAQQAIDLFQAHRGEVALLISDVVMPHTTGPILYQSLVAEAPHLKVLFLSGYTSDILRGRGVLQDMPFLPKPFSLSDLARKVRQTLNDRRDGRNDLAAWTSPPDLPRIYSNE
jgi:two-component system cell cycle sensor histidine kinase/response regulator CckA